MESDPAIGLIGRRVRAWLTAAACTAAAASWSADAGAGELPQSAFQTYNPANAASIQPGLFSLFLVPVNSLVPTQLNVGLSEVAAKTAAFNLLQPSQLNGSLLASLEP